jgi:hypothetical protein
MYLMQGLGVQVVGALQGLVGGLVGLGEGVLALPVRLAVLAAAAVVWGRILLRVRLMALGDLEGAAAHLGRCVGPMAGADGSVHMNAVRHLLVLLCTACNQRQQLCSDQG